jgi:branched-chain amino acid transport system ATP-binding protein
MNSPLLLLEEISVRYGALTVVHDVSLNVKLGEVVCVLGANGAGKTTLLKAIMGAQPVSRGRVLFDNEEIHHLKTERIVRLGLVYVPEERMLFHPLSVEENLRLGAYTLRNGERISANLDFVYGLFPRLRERRTQAASTLSGGEQQMLAIGRGLMSNPRMLMLDEPSLGLAPLLVEEVMATVRKLKEEGMTILLVEQSVREALEIADRGYVLQTGRIVLEGTCAELMESETIRQTFLGL